MEKYNGIALDTRSNKEIKKDWNAKDLVSGYIKEPVFRVINSISSIPLYFRRDQDGSGSCFPSQTRVLMEDFKYKQIKDIRIGDKVLTDKGTKHKVTHLFKRKWQGNTYNIKVKGILNEIEATGEHPFLIIEGSETKNNSINLPTKWVEAKNIKVGDFASLPINNFSKDITLRDYEKDPEFLWCFGLYLAEGSLDKYCVNFSLHKKETEYLERLKKCFENYGSNVTMSLKTGSLGMQVKLQGQDWVKIFEDLGNKICDKKEINHRLLLLEPKLQMNIVDGYFDGDGYLKNDNRHIFVGTSKVLMEQIQFILRRNGIHSFLNTRKKLEERKQVYVLEYSNDSRFSFYRDGYLFVRIDSVKNNKSYSGGHVYNIEVETENTYQVEGVAVHNCVAQSLAKLIEIILLKKRGIHFKFSATPIYQKRSNKPEAGMIGQNAMDIVVKFFTCLEDMVKSENMNDSMMDSLPVYVN